jgi:hypothetical protein
MSTQKEKVAANGPISAHSSVKRARQTVAPIGNPKLAALKRARFSHRGRAKRIQRAQQALIEIDRIGSTFKLDKDTLMRLAEDPDLEYL